MSETKIKTRLSGDEALKAVAAGALLIDVRSAAGRGQNGEVEGAAIIAKTDVAPLLAGPLDAATAGQKIVLFCGSIKGTEAIVEALVAAGRSAIYDVDGGFAALTGPGGLKIRAA